jgi:hypothetical protein
MVLKMPLRRAAMMRVLVALCAGCGGAIPEATTPAADTTAPVEQDQTDTTEDEPEPPSTIAHADITGTALAQDESRLFFAGPPLAAADGGYEGADGDLVWTVAKKGGEPVPLFDGAHGPVKGVAVGDGKVLWTVSGTLVLSAQGDMAATTYRKGQVMRATTAGKGSTVLARNQAEPGAIVAAGGRVFWISQIDDTGERSAIRRAPIKGGKTKTLSQGKTAPVAIAANERHVFWLSSGEGEDGWETYLWRIGVDGGKVKQLATLPGEPGVLTVSGDTVFAASSAQLAQVPAGGGEPVLLDEGLNEPRGIAVDAQFVYWTDRGLRTVKRAAVGGGDVEVLATDQREPGGITVDDRGIYWMVKGAIRKIDKHPPEPQAKADKPPDDPQPADPFAPLAEQDEGPASLPEGASQGGTTSIDDGEDPEQLPPKWIKCKRDKQCVLIEAGCCYKIGVNKKFRKKARKKLPRSTCDTQCDYGNIEAVCEDRNCRAVIRP